MFPANPGLIPDFTLEGGELHIRLGDWLVCIRGWPEPSARYRRKSAPWKNFRPEFRLLKPGSDSLGDEAARGRSSADLKLAAFRMFRSEFPDEIAAAVERFQSHQFNMLDLLSKEQAALDLAASNPPLFYCLSNNDQFRKLLAESPAAAAGKHVPQRQRQILEWLGFPTSESMVRIFRKILPESVAPHDIRVLCQSVQSDPEVGKLLVHLPVIHAGVLGLVGNLKLLAAISPRLVTRVAESDEERIHSRTADLLVDSLYLLRSAGIRWKVPRFESIQAVREFQERVAAEWLRITTAPPPAPPPRRQDKRPKPAPRPQSFPPPPIPGTEEIVPLSSESALRAEGKAQHNCIGSYVSKVRRGGIYIYKVLAPERATLSIFRGADGCWHRGEIGLLKNRGRASTETRAAVDQWLYRHSISA
jgi:hypothetical protein